MMFHKLTALNDSRVVGATDREVNILRYEATFYLQQGELSYLNLPEISVHDSYWLLQDGACHAVIFCSSWKNIPTYKLNWESERKRQVV